VTTASIVLRAFLVQYMPFVYTDIADTKCDSYHVMLTVLYIAWIWPRVTFL